MPNPTPTTGIFVNRPSGLPVFSACKKEKIAETLKLLSRQHPGIYAGDGVTAAFVEEDRAANGYTTLEAIDLAKAGYVKPEAPVTP